MGEILDWDSRFFGRRIAKSTVKRLSESSARQLLDWCGDRDVDCLYFLADSCDSETMRWANEYRFEFVDIRVTFSVATGAVTPFSSPSSVSLFEDRDLDRLRQMARVSHGDSRFYCDWRFSRERCDALFDTWIEKSCAGWADAVFVAREGDLPIGYCTCHKSRDGRGSIGLIAVDSAQRGRGAGQQLVSAATEYFRREGIGEVQVVTQGRNRASQRLYQRCGFRTELVEIWYHRWFVRGDREG